MRISTRVIALGVAALILSSCMKELATPPTIPTAVIVDQKASPEAPAPLVPIDVLPTAVVAPEAAPESPSDSSGFVEPIDCANPTPDEVAACTSP